MTLDQYAAQNAQEIQQTQQVQAAQAVEEVSEKLDSELLSSLVVQLQESIEEGAAPAVMLEQITGTLFGSSSPQAAAVAAIIDADRHPSGHEMAVAAIRAQRRQLRQLRRQLEEQAKTITDELQKLDEAERALLYDGAQAAELDRGLMDVLIICKQLDDPQGDLLQVLAALYDRHKGNRAAMGLLHGCMEELTHRGFSAGNLDLIQQQQFSGLKDRIAAAIMA